MTAQVSVDDREDPFQAFNRAMGAGIITDPYPGFKAQRDEGARFGPCAEAVG